MQDETPNTIDRKSDKERKSIDGGCGKCGIDTRIASEANRTHQEYRYTIRLHVPEALPAQQYQVVKNQGQEAVDRMVERHPHPIVAREIRNMYPNLRD